MGSKYSYVQVPSYKMREMIGYYIKRKTEMWQEELDEELERTKQHMCRRRFFGLLPPKYVYDEITLRDAQKYEADEWWGWRLHTLDNWIRSDRAKEIMSKFTRACDLADLDTGVVELSMHDIQEYGFDARS